MPLKIMNQLYFYGNGLPHSDAIKYYRLHYMQARTNSHQGLSCCGACEQIGIPQAQKCLNKMTEALRRFDEAKSELPSGFKTVSVERFLREFLSKCPASLSIHLSGLPYNADCFLLLLTNARSCLTKYASDLEDLFQM
jgi:hypothetical protein